MKKNLLLLVAVSSFSLGWVGVAHAQILTDGGFESTSGTKQTDFIDVPGWNDVNGSPQDSGVQEGTVGTSSVNNQPQAGSYFSYEMANDTGGGAYQITGTTVGTGDTLTLTWYATNTYVPSNDPAGSLPIQGVDILASGNGSLSKAIVLASTVTNTGAQASGYALNSTADSPYEEFTLTTVVPTADAGDYIGVSFDTTGATGSYANYDSFTLTDTPAATPEPSSLALALVSVGGLFLVNRLRRSLA